MGWGSEVDSRTTKSRGGKGHRLQRPTGHSHFPVDGCSGVRQGDGLRTRCSGVRGGGQRLVECHGTECRQDLDIADHRRPDQWTFFVVEDSALSARSTSGQVPAGQFQPDASHRE